MVGSNSLRGSTQKQSERIRTSPDSTAPVTLRGQTTSSAAVTEAPTKASIETLLHDLEDRLSKRIVETSKQLDEKITKMCELFEGLKGALERRMDGVEEKVKSLECQCSLLKEENEGLLRSHRLTDVIIKGIPIKSDDNPSKILHDISSVINHTLTTYVDAFRIKVKTNSSHGSSRKSSSPIIARFSCHGESRAFISAFRRCRGVKLCQIDGFSSDSKVYANESLTPRQSSILREAQRLRRAGSLSAVTTRGGVVLVKKRTDHPFTKIFNFSELIPLANSER